GLLAGARPQAGGGQQAVDSGQEEEGDRPAPKQRASRRHDCPVLKKEVRSQSSVAQTSETPRLFHSRGSAPGLPPRVCPESPEGTGGWSPGNQRIARGRCTRCGGGVAPLPSWVRKAHRVHCWLAARLIINGAAIRPLRGYREGSLLARRHTHRLLALRAP